MKCLIVFFLLIYTVLVSSMPTTNNGAAFDTSNESPNTLIAACKGDWGCPPKPPVTDPGDPSNNQETPETPGEVEPEVHDASETQLDKRRHYRSPKPKPDDNTSEESSAQVPQEEPACKQWWDCGNLEFDYDK
ncbi:hypothetical protein BDV26DRAFT_291494 [Aspergillus bertholletiae]|uniref:Secreted protein n=1 Tax=Aspergillus bertholletiae TaxID=1226010 RepID=A0A5N7BBN7_9EURO|nr:hypothetical protein BDV26DRAFT_291494 [Aspergillus bertholletiae]